MCSASIYSPAKSPGQLPLETAKQVQFQFTRLHPALPNLSLKESSLTNAGSESILYFQLNQQLS
jgi:hypothetical protein